MKETYKAIGTMFIIALLVYLVYGAKHYGDARHQRLINEMRKQYSFTDNVVVTNNDLYTITNDIRWEKAISSQGPILLDHKEGKFYYER